jgi:hypothetical protein
LEPIIDSTILKNWNYSEGRWVLNLRLLCSKPFILPFHFAVSQLNSSFSVRIVWSYRFEPGIHKLDIDAKNEELRAAAGGEHETIVSRLLDAGANVNVAAGAGYDSRTALQAAAGGGHEAVVQLLLEKGNDVAAKDNHDGSTAELETAERWTGLQVATENGHKTLVRLLAPPAPNSERQNQYSSAMH